MHKLRKYSDAEEHEIVIKILNFIELGYNNEKIKRILNITTGCYNGIFKRYNLNNKNNLFSLAKENLKKEYTRNDLLNLVSIYKYDFNGLKMFLNRNSLSTLSLLKKHNIEFITKDEAHNLINEHHKILKISKLYNMPSSTLSGIFKRYGITSKVQTSKLIKQNIIDDLQSGLTVNKISQKYNVNRYAIRDFCNNNNIQFKNFFEKHKDTRNNIINDINFYVNENKTKTLNQISIENDISIEQLKKVFRETNNDVILHLYNKSKGQLEIEDYIKSLNFSCVTTKKKYNNRLFEIDCYVADKKFGVEYCGEYWHSYMENSNKNYHKNKFFMSKALDIKLMTIFEHEFINKPDIIKSMINSRLGINKKIFARKTSVKLINNIQANQFHNKNHINGYVHSSINIGLFNTNELVSVLSLSKSRFNKKYQYEITRYSTELNHNVIGGFSKLFNFFIKIKNPDSCMTYADLRFGEGLVYTKANFSYSHTTGANYWYFNKKNPIGFESRMKYQKKNLIKKYPEKTGHEFDIMSSLGYLRIYDCGSNVFTWFKTDQSLQRTQR